MLNVSLCHGEIACRKYAIAAPRFASISDRADPGSSKLIKSLENEEKMIDLLCKREYDAATFFGTRYHGLSTAGLNAFIFLV